MKKKPKLVIDSKTHLIKGFTFWTHRFSILILHDVGQCDWPCTSFIECKMKWSLMKCATFKVVLIEKRK